MYGVVEVEVSDWPTTTEMPSGRFYFFETSGLYVLEFPAF